MADLETTQEKRASRLLAWIPIVISVVALGLSGYEFYDNHQRNVAIDTPRVDVDHEWPNENTYTLTFEGGFLPVRKLGQSWSVTQ
jgi:hypothetical protein